MTVPTSARAAGRIIRLQRPHHDHHLADGGNVELETLAMAEPGRMNHLEFGQLVVVGADAVDGTRTETVQAPEFTNCKFRGVSNVPEYIRIARGAHETKAAQ